MRLTDATYRIEGRTLRIRKTDPDGHRPRPREIEVRIDGGAWAETFEMDAEPTTEDHQLAVLVAGKAYGTKGGRPRATNSEVHEIWNAMRDIAGC
jgi:hypothetical protein